MKKEIYLVVNVSDESDNIIECCAMSEEIAETYIKKMELLYPNNKYEIQTIYLAK